MIQKIYCGENQISIEQKLQNDDIGNGWIDKLWNKKE